MNALGFTLLLFVCWGFIGLAVLNTLNSRRNLLRNVLLAPGVGAGVIVLFAFWCNRLGYGIGPLAPWLAGGLMVGAGALHVWRRTAFPWRRFAPFALIIVAAALATGRPMLSYGLDWLGLSNDDMANYVLAAQYYSENGKTDVPDWNRLRQSTDLVAFSYFVQKTSSTRFGSELLMDVTQGVSRVNMLRVFMPVILALHLCLVSVVGAMVLIGRKRWRAMLACGLAGLSPLMTFGVTNQLIAQVFGLVLLAICATLLLDSWHVRGSRELLLASIVLSALLITYPEMLPILGLAGALWFGVSWLKKEFRWPILARAAIGGVGSLLFLNAFALDLARFLIHQGGEAMAGKNQAMPFFLLSTGGAHLWGILPLSGFDNDPHVLFFSLAGLCLTAAAVAAAIWLARKGMVAALVMVSLVAAAVVLLFRQSGFGAFKIASYIQPFMAAVVAAGWIPSRRPSGLPPPAMRTLVAMGMLVFVVFYQAKTQWGFVTDSTGEVPSAVNIASASRLGLATELQHDTRNLKAKAVLATSDNTSLLKLEGLFLRGVPLAMPSVRLYDVRIPRSGSHFDKFDYGNGTPPVKFFRDERVSEAAIHKGVAVIPTPEQTVLNRSQFLGSDNEILAVVPMQNVQNLLTFVSSDRSKVFMDSDKRNVGLFQLEGDPYVANSTLSALGRYLLFRVDNPVSGSRLVMDLTTLNRRGEDRQLPHPVVIGENRLTMEFAGSSSGRLVSPPVVPRVIDGVAYIGIDMATEGIGELRSHGNVTALGGEDVFLDARPRIAMARNISLIREDEYRALPAPRQVDDFPADLAQPSLEYSGISEDGWLGDRVMIRLRATEADSPLVIEGQSQDPKKGGASLMTARIDGRTVGSYDLREWDFTWKVDAKLDAGVHDLELEFNRVRRISTIDGRLASIRLVCAGFGREACREMPDDIVLTPGPVRLGRGWHELEGPASERFRQADGEGCVELRDTTTAGAKLEAEIELLPAEVSTFPLFELLAQGRKLAEKTTVEGRQTIDFALPAGLYGGTQLCLVAPLPAARAGGAPRTRPFRAYSIIGPEGARARGYKNDVVQWPLRVLSGWYPIEKWEGETFRWINTDASIYVPEGMHRLTMEIALGPGLAGKPLQAELLDRRGQVIATFNAKKRQKVTLKLPEGVSGRMMFRVKNRGVLYGVDPRILNFRVFSLRAE